MAALANKTRRLPIGVQSFSSLRDGGFVYVDKTKYIHDLVQKSKQYFLSRPRRFGKSLFLSTLKAYWEGKKELFTGLAIAELEKDNPVAWQSYPVFYFDFNKDSYQRDGALEDVLDEHLRGWEDLYGGRIGETLGGRFRSLLQRAYEKTGRGCVVLVDEYDKSLLEVLDNNELTEHNKAVFKGFFSTLKSYDQYLQFVFITGVTKFSKVSIFSDLNQLDDITMQPAYANICGITEAELQENFAPELADLAASQQMNDEECLTALRNMYDGYHFAAISEGVYNPFSLLKAFSTNMLEAYWFATGTPTFLTKQVKQMQLDASKFTNHTIYASGAVMTDYRFDNPDPIPLLYQTGYLTIFDYDARRQRYMLGFPNDEVKYGFLSSLLPVYTPTSTAAMGTDIFTIDEYIENGDIEGVGDIFKALFAGIPYTTDDTPFEHYFQSVIYLVFTLLGRYVHCEVHSAKGRADCIVETADYVYLFEFKVGKSAQEALAQIEEKGYAEAYRADKRKLYKIGVSFDGEKRSLEEWKVVE